jgi:hypothetical protein
LRELEMMADVTPERDRGERDDERPPAAGRPGRTRVVAVDSDGRVVPSPRRPSRFLMDAPTRVIPVTPDVPPSPRRPARLPRLSAALVPVLLLLAAFVAVMTYEAYIDASFHPDGEATASDSRASVPSEILTGGPYIDTTGGQVVSYDLPPKTVVLTFDDGPDPQWTPQVLDVLARHGVKATFFVVGTEVARYPEVVQAMVEQGHDLGVHTFTHADMAALSPWLRSLEYSQTQMALAATVGVTTPLSPVPVLVGRVVAG